MVIPTRILVVVPCGKAKVWDKQPNRGPVPAWEAYTGPPYVLNRAYAERFGDACVVLSAKYGIVPPEFEIPGPYEVSFKHPSTQPVTVTRLREQIRARDLGRFELVVGLGGKEYRHAVVAAFAPWPVRLAFPFVGLPIGKAMQATKRAVLTGEPGIAAKSKEWHP